MTDLPSLALSVRQPWAWAIIHAGKDIENRSRGTFGKSAWSFFKRRIAIQASKGMTQAEYRDARDTIDQICGAGTCPLPDQLVRGAIIGAVTVWDIRTACNHSPWFFGPVGMLLKEPAAVDPIPCDGALGYFEWKRADRDLEMPLLWMRKWGQPEPHKPLLALPHEQEGLL